MRATDIKIACCNFIWRPKLNKPGLDLDSKSLAADLDPVILGEESAFFLYTSFMLMFSNPNPSNTQLSFLLCRVWPSHSSRTRPTRRPWTRSRSDSRWTFQNCRKKSTSPPISRVDRRHTHLMTSGPEFETSHLFNLFSSLFTPYHTRVLVCFCNCLH